VDNKIKNLSMYHKEWHIDAFDAINIGENIETTQ